MWTASPSTKRTHRIGKKMAKRIEELSKEIETLKTTMKIQKTTTDGIVQQLRTSDSVGSFP
jgi:hypothetical protein